jgi:hypothetical protein
VQALNGYDIRAIPAVKEKTMVNKKMISGMAAALLGLLGCD